MFRSPTPQYFICLLAAFAFTYCVYCRFQSLEEVPETAALISQKPEKEHISSQVLYEQALNGTAEHFPLYTAKSVGGCVHYPDIFSLEYHNTYWQVMRHEGQEFYFFGAYFDDRPKKAVVRILSVVNRVYPTQKLYCQMWFENKTTVQITATKRYDLIWNNRYIKLKNNTFVGQLITCPLPEKQTSAPVSVSIAVEKCGQSKNSLKVHNERLKQKKKDFLVCVKGLDFPFDDDSVQLVEFVEANLMFGVDKIVLYDLQVHPNIRKVLEYYKKLGKVELHPLTLPSSLPNEPFLRHKYFKTHHTEKIVHELIPYNDCFYKNLHKYQYILLLDIDEVFIPVQGNNYQEMINGARSRIPGQHSTFYARNKIFIRDPEIQYYTNVPTELNMLQSSLVATNYEKPYVINVKSFFATQDILTLNNHMPYACLGACKKTQIPEDLGQLNHYRRKCFWENGSNCKEWSKKYNVTENTVFWRFKDEFISRTKRILSELDLV